MAVGSLIAIYFVVWWIVLFAILPWGIRTQDEEGEVILGTTSSAPTRPRLLIKALATSVLAGIVTALIWLAIDVYGFGVEELGEIFGPQP